MLGFLSLIDIVAVAPAAFSLGVMVGYIIRARYNGKETHDS